MPEVVPFSGSVMSEGLVEHWLSRLEGMMRKTLYDRTKASFVEYP